MIRTFEFDKYPIVEIVNDLIIDCIKRNASDIHFDPTSGPLKTRIRIDGSLVDYAEVPVKYLKNLTTRIKIIAGMNITETRLPQDGAIKTELRDMTVDLRVSALPTNLGEKIVIRILDYSMSAEGLEYLGLSKDNLKKVSHMISQPSGFILITGATGSGKSTTVYSILQKLNTEATNIISIEDPVEMNIEGINQVQINSEIGLTFANILRSILRQDPNIIMIGEIRDNETAKIAVRASVTGHLVLSTLHTNNALNTIERLLDMNVERYLLASALSGLVAQKLVKKLCPKCRIKSKANIYQKSLIERTLKKNVEEIWSAGQGCDQCHNGYRGRTAIHEVLLINQNLKDAISNGIEKSKLRGLVYDENTITMLADGLNKVLEGITTFDEIINQIEIDDDIEYETLGELDHINDLAEKLNNINFNSIETL